MTFPPCKECELEVLHSRLVFCPGIVPVRRESELPFINKQLAYQSPPLAFPGRKHCLPMGNPDRGLFFGIGRLVLQLGCVRRKTQALSGPPADAKMVEGRDGNNSSRDGHKTGRPEVNYKCVQSIGFHSEKIESPQKEDPDRRYSHRCISVQIR